MKKLNNWMNKLIEYSVTPQPNISPYLQNKSQVGKRFYNVILDNHSEQEVYEEHLNNLDVNLLKEKYWHVYKREAKSIFPNFTTLYNFYKNGNLTCFISVQVVRKDNNAVETINFFAVNYFPFSKNNEKVHYFKYHI